MTTNSAPRTPKRSFLCWSIATISLSVLGCNKSEAPNGGAAATASGAEAQGAAPAGKVLKLAFVSNATGEFWKIAAAGVRAYEKEGKVQVDVKMPPNGTADEQNQILENLSSQGYDAIAVSAVAPNDQVPILNKVAAKAKLVTIDSDAPKSNRLLYIGMDNYLAGKALGQEIVKLLPNGGKMAVFVGTLAADNAQQRFKGIQDVVTAAKIEIVDKREDNTDRNKARTNVEDILTAHKDLNLVAGLWSYNGPAIAAALEASGKKGKVLGAVFDEEDGTLTAIGSDTINCTVVQKPFQFGYLASKWMHELVTKPEAAAAIPASKSIDTGVDVINKGNVADFKQKLAELKK
ncbi:MAG TPA: sugar-binding protein [Polyangiaceae bacterium]